MTKPRNAYAIPAKARKNAGPMVHKGHVRNEKEDIEERLEEIEENEKTHKEND